MNRFLKIIGVVAILIIVPKVVQKVMLPDEKEKLNKEMATLVNDLNGKLPKQISPGVVLTKVEFRNNVFRNSYVLDADANFNISQRSIYEKYAVTQVCGSTSRELLKRGVTIEYSYKYTAMGIDNTFDISVPPSSCA